MPRRPDVPILILAAVLALEACSPTRPKQAESTLTPTMASTLTEIRPTETPTCRESLVPKNPRDRDEIISSGIAQRMIKSLNAEYTRFGQPSVDIATSDFSVDRLVDRSTGTEEVNTGVVIEFLNPAQSCEKAWIEFEVRSGESFGVFGEPPLTPEQFNLVKRLADQLPIPTPVPTRMRLPNGDIV